MTQWDRQRDIKRKYRKKSFQTGMSAVRSTSDNTPEQFHEQATATHQPTSPVRAGIDPRTYKVPIQTQDSDMGLMIDSSNYPWNTAPKPDSSNVIGRASFTGAIADNNYVDVVTLNVSSKVNSAPASAAGTRATLGAPTITTDAVNFASGTETGSGNPDYPQSGYSVAGVAGSVTRGGTGEIYRISSFGHSELTNTSSSTGTSTDPVTYQIWVDGKLFMEWQNFQWSAVTPKNSQWDFDVPITVTQQIVFRVINESGAPTASTHEIEACFSGWSEQMTGYTDISYQKLENS
jgi:hypothetical protein